MPDRRAYPYIRGQMPLQVGELPRDVPRTLSQNLIGEMRRRLDDIQGFIKPFERHPLMPEV